MAVNKSIEKEIQKIYESIFKKTLKEGGASLLKGRREPVIRGLLRLEKSQQFNKLCNKFAKKLSKKALKQKGLWRKFYEAARKNNIVGLPSTYSKFQLNQYRKAVIHNFEMIKSIPQHILKVYQQEQTMLLVQQVTEGKFGRGTFENNLKKFGHNNAKLIARTETAKLQTFVLEGRARDLGSIGYIWLSSNDKRTRPSHREMNGTLVLWRDKEEEKPFLDKMYGDAGEFPNCRCSPQPIFDESDLKKPTYEVYDYHNHKKINLVKSKLIKMLKEKKL